jgi:hypothetical protein
MTTTAGPHRHAAAGAIKVATGLVLSVLQAEAPHHGQGLSIDGVAVSAWLSRVPVVGGPLRGSADQRGDKHR